MCSALNFLDFFQEEHLGTKCLTASKVYCKYSLISHRHSKQVCFSSFNVCFLNIGFLITHDRIISSSQASRYI